MFYVVVVIFGKQWNNSHNPILQAGNTYLKKRFMLVDKDEEDEIINTLSLYCLAVIRSVLGMLGVAWDGSQGWEGFGQQKWHKW